MRRRPIAAAEGSTRGTGSPGNRNDTLQRREHALVDHQTSIPSEESPTASACCTSDLPMPDTIIDLDRATRLHQAGDLEAAAVAYTKLLRVSARIIHAVGTRAASGGGREHGTGHLYYILQVLLK